MNPVLTRLKAERAQQIEVMDGILNQVENESRDLVDAETRNLDAARERINQLDAQIEPLEAFDGLRSAHDDGSPALSDRDDDQHRNGAGNGRQRLTVNERPHEYRSAGEFIVDVIRGNGSRDQNIAADRDAAARVASTAQTRAEHQTTSDTPGLLPEQIIGQILTDIDGARPFVNSIGVQPLAGIPGTTFHRPHVTQHTATGEQTDEKGELPTRQFKVEGVPFNKHTFGGYLNVSRQSMDWTSPSAWNALLADLQMEYAGDTDDWAAGQFAEGVEQSVDLAEAANIRSWVGAMYRAAIMSATANGTKKARAMRLPNHIWVSLDQWANLGTVIDSLRVTQQSNDNPGTSTPTAFSGDILSIPRTVVPGLPAGTVVVGRSDFYEFYEERIGLLSAIEPKVLGVEVAYGGYGAAGFLDPTAFTRFAVDSDAVVENVERDV